MANYYVTVSGAGNNSGDSWANAMTIAEFEAAIEGASHAGDYYFFAGGTYTLASAIYTTYDGTNDLPVEIIGVNSGTTNEPPIASDWATGTNRPLIDCGASYWFNIDGGYHLRNFRITGSAATVCNLGTYSKAFDCLFTSTGSNAALKSHGYGVELFNCEITSASSYGLDGTSAYDFICFGCYIHDCSVGVNGKVKLYDCIIDTCTTGIEVEDLSVLFNCTIYNCTDGIKDIDGYYGSFTVLNTTISSCTNGFNSDKSGTICLSFYFDYNNWYDNTKDMSWDNGSTEDNSAKGDNDIAVDPGFTNAAGGDFSISTSSSLFAAGYQPSLGVG